MTAGRTDVTRRALERAVAAVAADALGAGAGRVRVRLADDRGSLAIDLSAPVTTSRGTGLVTRAAAWQDQIRRTATDLTGHTVSRVTLRFPRTTEPQKGAKR